MFYLGTILFLYVQIFYCILGLYIFSFSNLCVVLYKIYIEIVITFLFYKLNFDCCLRGIKLENCNLLKQISQQCFFSVIWTSVKMPFLAKNICGFI